MDGSGLKLDVSLELGFWSLELLFRFLCKFPPAERILYADLGTE
jgi:hypothetical protein